MLTLYHSPRSRSSRIIWLLEELGAEYEIRQVSIVRGMEQAGAPDPANPHPAKQVPALLDGDVLITESVAITLYLLERFPDAGLAPPVGHPDRGPFLAWMVWYVAEMEPAMFYFFAGELDATFKAKAFRNMQQRVVHALAARPYLLGDSFSAIDMFVASTAKFARQVLPEDPRIDAYVERVTARPALARAQAKDGTL